MTASLLFLALGVAVLCAVDSAGATAGPGAAASETAFKHFTGKMGDTTIDSEWSNLATSTTVPVYLVAHVCFELLNVTFHPNKQRSQQQLDLNACILETQKKLQIYLDTGERSAFIDLRTQFLMCINASLQRSGDNFNDGNIANFMIYASVPAAIGVGLLHYKIVVPAAAVSKAVAVSISTTSMLAAAAASPLVIPIALGLVTGSVIYYAGSTLRHSVDDLEARTIEAHQSLIASFKLLQLLDASYALVQFNGVTVSVQRGGRAEVVLNVFRQLDIPGAVARDGLVYLGCKRIFVTSNDIVLTHPMMFWESQHALFVLKTQLFPAT